MLCQIFQRDSCAYVIKFEMTFSKWSFNPKIEYYRKFYVKAMKLLEKFIKVARVLFVYAREVFAVGIINFLFNFVELLFQKQKTK